jgi:hypothetical protein
MFKKSILTIIMLLGALAIGSAGVPENLQPYLGRWALSLPGGAGWLEVRQEKDYLDADILWYGGSVVPVDHVFLNGETLVISRTRKLERSKDASGNSLRTQIATEWLECDLNNDLLVGTLFSPNNDAMGVKKTKFMGKKIPDLPPAPAMNKIKYGKPISLFNGKDLSGWTLTNPNQKLGFKVENGALINDPVQIEGQSHINYGNLQTINTFEDFNLKLQVSIPKGNNSGIYLRGIYEVQVLDSYGQPLDSHNMGAIYSRIAPTMSAEKPAGEWQDMEMILCNRHVTVVLNGKKIIDNQPLMGCTGGALTADEFAPGPIYLQGDHGKVMYRNLVLTPILK